MPEKVAGNSIPEQLDDTLIQVSFFLSNGEKTTLKDVPRYFHEAVKYAAEQRKIPWNDIYKNSVEQGGLTIEAVKRYMGWEKSN